MVEIGDKVFLFPTGGISAASYVGVKAGTPSSDDTTLSFPVGGITEATYISFNGGTPSIGDTILLFPTGGVLTGATWIAMKSYSTPYWPVANSCVFNLSNFTTGEIRGAGTPDQYIFHADTDTDGATLLHLDIASYNPSPPHTVGSDYVVLTMPVPTCTGINRGYLHFEIKCSWEHTALPDTYTVWSSLWNSYSGFLWGLTRPSNAPPQATSYSTNWIVMKNIALHWGSSNPQYITFNPGFLLAKIGSYSLVSMDVSIRHMCFTAATIP